jgi:hypothetical protein
MQDAYRRLEQFFGQCVSNSPNYGALKTILDDILQGLQQYPAWLEKKRWSSKISVYPEIKTLWNKVLDGSVKSERAQQLFCFNLLRLCEPIAKPHGPEFKETLKAFVE